MQIVPFSKGNKLDYNDDNDQQSSLHAKNKATYDEVLLCVQASKRFIQYKYQDSITAEDSEPVKSNIHGQIRISVNVNGRDSYGLYRNSTALLTCDFDQNMNIRAAKLSESPLLLHQESTKPALK